MSPRASFVIVLALAALSACTSGIGLAAPRGMNHPVDVAFACFDVSITGMPQTRPLHDCAMFVDVPSNTRQPPVNAGLHMHALVTQSTRGEVGAVDLIARTELDSDMSVPGYTFVPVGQLPTQIVVPPTDASCTYVASRGPVDGRRPGISVIDTRRFRSGAGLDHNPFPIFAPFVLPAAPSDMVLAPDEGSLWVAMDALGVIVRIPILGSCRLGAIDLVVPLYEEVPPGVVFSSSADLARTCFLAPGTTPAAPFVAPPRTPDVDLNTEPEPVAIAMDVDNGVILVADRALPLIHRVNIADGTLLPPLATGVPVRDVVVTPRVPDSYDLTPDGLAPVDVSEITFSRYVYAIDDTDGTVLAMEYTDPTARNFGEVIPVDVQGSRRPDRLAMPIVARTLEIITPQFDTAAADPRAHPADEQTAGNPFGYGLCFPSAPAPSQPPSPLILHGVFLVVAGADGAIRVIDIYDMDAPCRGREIGAPITPNSDCINPTQIGDIAVYVRRHRPRVQQLLATFVTILTGPSVNFPGGGSQVLGLDGLPVGHDPTMAVTTPSLEALVDPDDGGNYDFTAAACPAGLGMVWGGPFMNPETGSGDLPIVCSLVDPFAAVAEQWTATFEGTIPGTYTSSANAQTTDPAHAVFNGTIETRLDYCSLGVIGSVEAVAAGPSDPEVLYGGDMMSIISVMPETNLEADPGRCFPVVGITQVGQTQLPILVRIDHAFSSPPGQREPYTAQLVMEPTTPLEQRSGVATGQDCTDSTDCVSADYPQDTCDENHQCVHFPTIADAIRCYGDTLITIDVRSHGAFTVSGSRTGFQSRVMRRDTDGACVFDPTADRLRQGRAFNDVLFQNHRIAFRPRGGTTVAEIRMVLTGGPSQLGIDLSQSANGTRGMALTAGLRYSPDMWALYAIEPERGGLVELTLRPLSRTSTAYQ